MCSFSWPEKKNYKSGYSVPYNHSFLSESFLFHSYILDKAVTTTGYISHWNLNRRAIPNQIGTNFFQYKLSSFTANLLSVGCANLSYGSQHFYLCPSIQAIRSFLNSYVFFSSSFLMMTDKVEYQFFPPFIPTLFHLKENY